MKVLVVGGGGREHAVIRKLKENPEVLLWVLKENERAVRFYEMYGFSPTGEEKFLPSLAAAEIRMILRRTDA